MAKLIDSMVWDGLWDVYNDFHMGMTARAGGREVRDHARGAGRLRRQEHRRAAEATAAGRLEAEKFAVKIPQRKGEPLCPSPPTSRPARDTTAEGIGQAQARLQAEGGTVTAANASSINDGAAAVVVMSPERAKALGLLRWRASPATPPAAARPSGS
jgi:acetyl-CoA C-acetyltransferase